MKQSIMKTFRHTGILCIVLFSLSLVSYSQTLHEKIFKFESEAEAVLKLNASSPGANWAVKGSEAATVTIEVDGKYNQDVILFGGAAAVDYSVLLG